MSNKVMHKEGVRDWEAAACDGTVSLALIRGGPLHHTLRGMMTS